MSIITIQPAQTDDIDAYDPRLPLPYPFHINTETQLCERGRGSAEYTGEKESWFLIGFQRRLAQTVVLMAREFFTDPERAVGLVPVWSDGDKFFTTSGPISSVMVN